MLQLSSLDIHLEKSAANKQEAIDAIAFDLIEKGFVSEGYEQGMQSREQQNSTFLGNGIAIPHGTTDTRDLVAQTGVQIHHFPNGVDWGDGNLVYLAIGIAAKSDEHLGILKQLTHVLCADGIEDALKQAKCADDILAVLNGNAKTADTGFLFDDSVIAQSVPVADILTLAAVGASRLKQANTVSDTFITNVISAPVSFLVNGLVLISSAVGVTRTSIAFVTPELPFEHDNQKVKGLMIVAANSQNHLAVMENLSTLIYTNKVNDLFSASKDDIVKLLTQIRNPGTSRIFTIKNEHGLHARPGATLVSVVKKFGSKIWVANISTDSEQVNAKSLMKVIALGVKYGHQLEFTASGEDADDALNAIEQAIDAGLGEA